MRFTVLFFLLSVTLCCTAYAQHDSVAAKDNGVLTPVDPKTVNPFLPDSAIKSSRQRFIEDSVAMFYLIPNPARRNQVIDSMFKTDLYKLLLQPAPNFKIRAVIQTGKVRNRRDSWMIIVVIGLLIYTGLLNLFLGNDIRDVILSSFNKHALSQTDKEGGLINSWAYLGLFILFSLTMGLFLYQLSLYFNSAYSIGGFLAFLRLSVIISLLLALKFVILKLAGFIFEIGGMVSEYLAVLNLTYFNMAFVLLGVAICFSLVSSQFIPLLLTFTTVAAILVIAWQYIRNSVSIISDFRFHKFYLFVYLCALEICPVLILIKALNI